MTLSQLALLPFLALISPSGDAPLPPPVGDPGGAAILQKAGLRGTFVLYDVGRKRMTATDVALAGATFLPMSTFKIPNTLIGLGTGVIPDERFTLPWDGKDHGRPTWNRDHTLVSAIQESVLWYYQEVARRIGPERMKAWLDRLGYGNRDISGGIDRFWLDGRLRISPVGQIVFLDRLRTRTLPVRPEHAELVERITTLESAPGWVWRGKTGTSNGRKPLAWLVGSTERDGRAYVYAFFAEDRSVEKLMRVRKDLVRRLLEHAGALPRR